MRRRGERGFTLLEIVVALGIVAVALGAAMKGIGSHIGTAAQLKEMTLARWVGLNQIATMQLSGDWPSPRTYSGTVTMAGREWYWSAEVTAQEGDFVRRLDVTVAPAERRDEVLATLIGFVGKP